MKWKEIKTAKGGATLICAMCVANIPMFTHNWFFVTSVYYVVFWSMLCMCTLYRRSRFSWMLLHGKVHLFVVLYVLCLQTVVLFPRMLLTQQCWVLSGHMNSWKLFKIFTLLPPLCYCPGFFKQVYCKFRVHYATDKRFPQRLMSLFVRSMMR